MRTTLLTRCRRNARPAAILVVALASASIAVACGSLQSATTTPAGTVGAANATATEFFNVVNEKNAAVGAPTFKPGTDPLRPYANVTFPPLPTRTPGPSPTPVTPDCGATIAGWPEIASQYGESYRGTYRCLLVDGQLVITVAGLGDAAGAIATYPCQPNDASCLRGAAPSAPGARWSVYPAPDAGVEIFRLVPPSKLLILPGEYCFDVATHEYDLDHGCWDP